MAKRGGVSQYCFALKIEKHDTLSRPKLGCEKVVGWPSIKIGALEASGASSS